MGTKIIELTQYLESIAPLQYQEKYDNCGLLVGNENAEISGVLVCLDSLENVVDEAIELGYNLIIAHHPIIFSGIKKLTGKTYIGRTLLKAIKNDVAIYAWHTNLDNHFGRGVSRQIANLLDMERCEILQPKMGHMEVERDFGTGVIGFTKKPFEEQEFLLYLKERLSLNMIRHSKFLGKPVQKVAICGGSGAYLLKDVKNQGADIYITADFKYHEYFDADGQLIIADIGHYESEYHTIQLIYDIIKEKYRNFAARCTKVVTNPIKYL